MTTQNKQKPKLSKGLESKLKKELEQIPGSVIVNALLETEKRSGINLGNIISAFIGHVEQND